MSTKILVMCSDVSYDVGMVSKKKTDARRKSDDAKPQPITPTDILEIVQTLEEMASGYKAQAARMISKEIPVVNVGMVYARQRSFASVKNYLDEIAASVRQAAAQKEAEELKKVAE